MNAGIPWPARLLPRICSGWRVVALLVASVSYLALGGCATWQPPKTVDDAVLRGRTVDAAAQDIHLSAAVLSAEDSRRMFGANLIETGVQPVWVEVENRTPHSLWLLRSGTDPDYFSPLEVAWSFHTPLASESNAAIDEHFDQLGFENPIPGGSTRSGILFTNPHRRTKLLNVDLLGPRKLIPFTLFLPVPDEAPDYQRLRILRQHTDTHGENVDDPDAFRAVLERLPCCAMGAKESVSGDPINIVVVGEFADIGAALVRRGFRKEAKDLDGAQKLFDRPPDVVVRKRGQGDRAPANWMRMWLAPVQYRGQPVFLAQSGRPVGGRFTVAGDKELVLHPDVDEARNLLVQDLMYSGGLAKLGFVAGVDAATLAQPQDSLAGTNYYTDGLRAVMFFASRPLALSDVQLLDWIPYLEHREANAATENTDAKE